MFCNRLPSSDDSYAKKWQTAALFVVGVAGREREGEGWPNAKVQICPPTQGQATLPEQQGPCF